MEQLTFEQLPLAISELLEKVTKIEKQLLSSAGEQPPEETFEPINITEASKILNLSVSTIYGKVCRSEIPVNKRGKRLYFDRKELYEWIREGRRKTIHEIKGNIKAWNLKR